jgi:hypothetical protein
LPFESTSFFRWIGFNGDILILSAKSGIYQRNFRFISEISEISAESSFYQRNLEYISEILILSAKFRIYQRNSRFISEISNISANRLSHIKQKKPRFSSGTISGGTTLIQSKALHSFHDNGIGPLISSFDTELRGRFKGSSIGAFHQTAPSL